MKRRVVVVGVGSIGRRHVRLLGERDDVVVEVCEPNQHALAEAGMAELTRHASFERALETRPYAVVIATPVECHADQTVAALAAGSHVLCEKPMSATLAGAQRMREASRATRTVLSFGFNLHFHPGLRRVKALIEGGGLGQVLQLQYRTGSYITLMNSRSRYQATLRGALLMDYAHQPDAVYWLLGERPAGVYMVGRKAGALDFTSDPNFLTVVCDYASPILTTIELNYVQMPQRHEIEVIGDAGWAVFDFETGILRRASRETQSVEQETITVVRDDLYREEHATFLDASEGLVAAASPPDEAIVSMEIIEAAMKSWKTGVRVEVQRVECSRIESGNEALGATVARLRQFYESHLFDQMLPYWLERGIDDEYGAYLTGYSNDGRTLLHHYKLPWSQGRFVWLWARLGAQFPAHPLADRFLELSRSGADFLRAHCRLPNGNVAFTLDRDGIPILLDQQGRPRAAGPGERYDSSTYADLYVVYGLSEYARVAEHPPSLEFAWELYWSVVERYRQGRFRTDPYPTPRGYQAHGVAMFMLDTGRELAVSAEILDCGATAELRALVGELVSEVMDRRRQDDDVIIELLGDDDLVRATKLGTYLNPGLMFQDMWFIMHQAEEAKDRRRIEQSTKVVRRACELAWDEEYGGLLQFVHREGGPPRGEVPPEEAGHPMLANLDANWDGKFYWVHTEALYALLLCYFHTREPWAADWYRRVHDYTFTTFPSEQAGQEWINIRNRDGTPSTKPAAVPVKDPFHAPRDMLLAIALLERWE